jgi:hypothetical protein
MQSSSDLELVGTVLSRPNAYLKAKKARRDRARKTSNPAKAEVKAKKAPKARIVSSSEQAACQCIQAIDQGVCSIQCKENQAAS